MRPETASRLAQTSNRLGADHHRPLPFFFAMSIVDFAAFARRVTIKRRFEEEDEEKPVAAPPTVQTVYEGQAVRKAARGGTKCAPEPVPVTAAATDTTPEDDDSETDRTEVDWLCHEVLDEDEFDLWAEHGAREDEKFRAEAAAAEDDEQQA